MGAVKEWFVTMRDEDYKEIPFEMRQRFKSEKGIYPDEHQKLWDNDEEYRKVYSNYSKAKKKLDEYKFRKRYPKKPF